MDKKEAAGLFDEIEEDDIERKITERKAVADVDVSDNLSNQPRRKGRPRSATLRKAFTCRPKIETVKKLQQYSFAHDVTMSDIIDTLVDHFLESVEEYLPKK